jgi:hypothetical protein
VAAEEVAWKRDEVYYYPSIESVNLSDSKVDWYDDLRHVRTELVDYNVGRFMGVVAGGPLDVDGKHAIIKS